MPNSHSTVRLQYFLRSEILLRCIFNLLSNFIQDDEDDTVQTLIKLVMYTMYFHDCPFDPKGDRFINEIQAANTAELESETTEVKLIDHIAAVSSLQLTYYSSCKEIFELHLQINDCRWLLVW